MCLALASPACIYRLFLPFNCYSFSKNFIFPYLVQFWLFFFFFFSHFFSSLSVVRSDLSISIILPSPITAHNLLSLARSLSSSLFPLFPLFPLNANPSPSVSSSLSLFCRSCQFSSFFFFSFPLIVNSSFSRLFPSIFVILGSPSFLSPIASLSFSPFLSFTQSLHCYSLLLSPTPCRPSKD